MNMPSAFSINERNASQPADMQQASGLSAYCNQLEPPGLIEHFAAQPPEGFEPFVEASTPGFFAQFDLLTTADPSVAAWLARIPGGALVRRLLRFRTCFFGTTVSEYMPMPRNIDSNTLPGKMLEAWNRRSLLVIVKDVPEPSALLPASDTAQAEAFLARCVNEGFILVEGQALAYVAVDFASEDEYLSRQSSGRRKNIRRKLRVRDQLRVEVLATGHERLLDACFLDELYELYLEVYAQSEIHFDQLTPGFFKAILQDATLNGELFLYYNEAQLIGYNLCFVHANMLIDKYVGFRYPAARDFNLYFVSWMENLAYARKRGLSHYVAGWTDPEVKAFLGASFTFTRHAVYVRNPLLRAVLRRFSKLFESDRTWFEQRGEES